MLRKVSSRDKAWFLRQLSSMVGAGIQLLRALEIILEQKLSKNLKVEINTIIQKVKEGSSLSFALQESQMGDVTSHFVGVGEECGKLAEALNSASHYLEEREATRRRISGSLIYPVFILSLSFLSIILLVMVILPMFSEIFRSLDVPLPLLTKYIILFSEFVSCFWSIIFLVFILVLISLYSYSKREKGQRVLERIKFGIPFFGIISQKIILSKTLKALGSLLSSGVPITSALRTVASSAGSKFYKQRYLSILNDMEMGEKLSASMQKTRGFPPEAIQLTSAGEESGTLADMLIHLGKYYEDETEHAIKSLTSLVEPLSTILVGAVVGVIVIAMFLPLINLMNVLQR